MPYNVDKDQGGDSKNNTDWMERCVDKVMQSGKDKSSAIAICKAQLAKKKESSTDEIDPQIITSYDNYKEQAIRKLMNQGKTFNDANFLFEAILVKNNYIY